MEREEKVGEREGSQWKRKRGYGEERGDDSDANTGSPAPQPECSLPFQHLGQRHLHLLAVACGPVLELELRGIILHRQLLFCYRRAGWKLV